jgi:hypothetical protein
LLTAATVAALAILGAPAVAGASPANTIFRVGPYADEATCNAASVAERGGGVFTGPCLYHDNDPDAYPNPGRGPGWYFVEDITCCD